ncbi:MULTISPECIES: PAQR family membrane homeostasis protein TrhA [Psychrilyobacter]|uniref:Hemolysin III family protein n=1 Tax=Psychrilyobacter piezotolerans TaxID=2293438 RepID=A0ABX9KD20_9FUSO|nr:MULTISPECIES: hemolysin III family protein [Psychrilyobacter]MCS5422674.1 hemolysin III family protein [Psychrilyobacter sp. S5]NDI79202.1 hemolysin III family protein [Psychrilyobacter piezotolerans]RDE58883.1 hemolysin III family protein [Psychrilyobacter sp. S5]REI39393.1 hemolysin III family protein [Psychrilyobacter piezotolerans]
MKVINPYLKLEEYVSSITHLLGAGMAISGLAFLIIHAVQEGGIKQIIGFTVFGLSAIFLYLMSGIYHILPVGKYKKIFKILDHSAIYVLISGSYTPFLLILGGITGWVILGIQWTLTSLGILFKIKFAGRFQTTSTLIYLFMGWMIVFAFGNLRSSLNSVSLILLIAGGISYSVGAIFYSMKKVKYTHVIWHFFVIAGTTLHYLSVYHSI